MIQTIYKKMHRKLLIVAAVLGVVVAPISGVQIAHANPTFTLTSMSATVSGTNVTATATVQASPQTTAQYAGICARDAASNIWDFAKHSNHVITTTGTTLNGPEKTFDAGTYTYFTCISVNNVWYQAGASQTFTVGNATAAPAGSSYGDNALEHWSNAVKNRNTAPATWVAWGDSFTEGQGASSMQERWTNETLGSLRSTFPTTGVTGGVGYLPGFYSVYGPDSTWTPYTAAGGNHWWEDWGGSLGNRIISLQTGGYETFTVTGTSVDIMYSQGAGGTFSYKVDNGTAVNVNTTGSYIPSKKVNVSLGTPGTHTVTVTGVSGTSYFEGIMAYNGDETKGIRMYDAGHSGATTDDYVYSTWDQAEITASAKADLVTIELGANDFLSASATPAQVTTNLQDMIDSIRSKATTHSTHQPSIALVIPWDFSAYGPVNGYSWNDFADAIRDVATNDTSVGLLDLTVTGTPAGTGGGLYASDGLHPSDAGHAAIATAVASYID
ncbi:MAG TPA: SGNH/GDSL hydrolase family protein [Candidatus Saccharimonadales bacterium]|nr:SGNH/GDSL hydrolase family protein [Candidatus Saccharimonadales bacterium]